MLLLVVVNVVKLKVEAFAESSVIKLIVFKGDSLGYIDMILGVLGRLTEVFDTGAAAVLGYRKGCAVFELILVEVVGESLGNGNGGAYGNVRDGDSIAVLDRELTLVGCAFRGIVSVLYGVIEVVERTACAAEVERYRDRERIALTQIARIKALVDEVNGLLAESYVCNPGS